MESSQSAESLAEIPRIKPQWKRLQLSEVAMKEGEEKEKNTKNDSAQSRFTTRPRLHRSYTDPTDLLWVFRSRAEAKTSECDSAQPDLARKTEDRNGDAESLRDNAYNNLCGSKPSNERHKSVRRSSASNELADSMESHKVLQNIDGVAREVYLSIAQEEQSRRRKISAPPGRPYRRPSVTGMPPPGRRNSVVSIPTPRRGRRGSEAPSLTSLARKRASQTPPSYPVGLKRRTSKGFLNADLHLNIRAKAKHEMLANLVLPAFVEHGPRTRERRNTITGSGRTKKDEKRYQIAKEILRTEKKYLACLKTLNTVFEEPMREGNYIPQKYIDMVFPGELVQIRESHTLFMKDLEERLCSPTRQFDIVGDIFTKLSSSYHINVLRIYSDYVNNFPKAIAVINKCSRGSHKFRKFLESCSTSPECDGLDISAFLLTPIQRLPRYVLLLMQLSKYTDAGHPDCFHIENALEIMKQMINVLNDSIQSSCKLANNGSLRKTVKLKKSSKKKREIQKLRREYEENDLSMTRSVECSPSSPLEETRTKSTESVDQSSTSLTSFASPRPCSLQTLPAANRNSYSPESSTLKPEIKDETLRPVSTGDLDKFYDRENPAEFAVIEEEKDSKDATDKSSGTSKIKAAAGNMIRNLQRRSKRWRRSFDELALTAERRKMSEEERAEEIQTVETSPSKERANEIQTVGTSLSKELEAEEIQTVGPSPSKERAEEIQTVGNSPSKERAKEIQTVETSSSKERATEIQTVGTLSSKERAEEIQTVGTSPSKERANEIQTVRTSPSKERAEEIQTVGTSLSKEQAGDIQTVETSPPKEDDMETESTLSDLIHDTEEKDTKEEDIVFSEDVKSVSTLPRHRPMSSVLPTRYKSAESNVNELMTRVLSDNDLSIEQPRDSANIWVPRQRQIPARRRTSDVPSSVTSSTSRHSSVATSEASQLFGSRKSLLRISQESLTDSGVSETPHGSPSSTLTRVNTVPCRRKGSLSRSLCNFDAPSKPLRLDRRSWGECKLAELKEPSSREEAEVETNNNQPKNKRKLKKVMKDFFLGRKRNNGSHQVVGKRYLLKPDPKTVDEKISTV